MITEYDVRYSITCLWPLGNGDITLMHAQKHPISEDCWVQSAVQPISEFPKPTLLFSSGTGLHQP
jgi:hypothetical protein